MTAATAESEDKYSTKALVRRLLIDEAWPYRRRYVVAFVLMAIGAAATALTAYLLGTVINKTYVSKDFPAVVIVALIGIGESESDNRAEDAVVEAIHSPLLRVDIAGATGALINVTGGPDMTVSIESAMMSRDCSEKDIPSVPMEIPSLTPMVLKRMPTSPAATTPSFTFSARPRRCMLQEFPSNQTLAMPTSGFCMSRSVRPVA